MERFGRPVAIAADRWRKATYGTGCWALAYRWRRWSCGDRDIKTGRRMFALFRKAINKTATARPVTSLLLRSAMTGRETISDVAGNAKLAKAHRVEDAHAHAMTRSGGYIGRGGRLPPGAYSGARATVCSG